jgi:hypothetical protein
LVFTLSLDYTSFPHILTTPLTTPG